MYLSSFSDNQKSVGRLSDILPWYYTARHHTVMFTQ